MLAAIAHDLRTPLRSQGLNVNVLLPKALAAAPKRHRGLDSR
jgi:K+-sensing histidine kinase KdpD